MLLTYHTSQALTGTIASSTKSAEWARLSCPYSNECGTVDHTLFECTFFSGHRDELSRSIGRCLNVEDIPAIQCGSEFKGYTADLVERSVSLQNTEEVFCLFSRMVEVIMSLKEQRERTSQDVNKLSTRIRGSPVSRVAMKLLVQEVQIGGLNSRW